MLSTYFYISMNEFALELVSVCVKKTGWRVCVFLAISPTSSLQMQESKYRRKCDSGGSLNPSFAAIRGI
jgi:hypothetical protein